MRRRIALGLVGCLGMVHSARGEAPTYSKDVAPILQKNCQECHRPGQVAPFSLLTYAQAKKRATDLAHVTSEKIMPPWPASTKVGGPFRDQRVLSDAEVATLTAWAEAGAPEGNPKDAPEPRKFSSTWTLGEPDLVLTVPEPYQIFASGDDEFRVFVLKTNFPTDRWIRAVDFKPGNRKVVHHILAGIDTSGRARQLDAKDKEPGYPAVGGFGDGVPLRGFLPIWTPGSRPRYAPEGSGYVLPAGGDVLIQVHYHRSGKVEKDATSVGLYLSSEPLPKQVRTGFVFPNVAPEEMTKILAKVQAAQAEGHRPELNELLEGLLTIPAGDESYEIKASSNTGFMSRPLSRDILLTSVMPHMHWLGKDFSFTAVLPDDKHTRVPLIEIKHWNFNWQGTYAFVEPIKLPKGTYFEMLAHFDNSDKNPSNQNKPPKDVSWGEQTTNEMCIGVFEFVVADGADAPAPAKPKTDRKDAAQRE
ncbi:MAG: Copper type ascorbate-dependent monooxygenase, C-terminal domain protein [Planctomycetota bacterium]|nr:Copper type ascorbate-dependent monooxygenase, C-terminal domain protein [Planctomycetota bacterium]